MAPPADLAVVGAGAAGLYAALCAAREGASVTLISGRPLGETASYWAQGGLAAALAADDSPQRHLEDTLAAGRGLVRRSAAEVLCEEAPERFRDLERLGVRFDADRHGHLALGLEGGHGARRVAHAGGSATGRRILRTLSAVVAEHERIEVLEGRRAAALAMDDGAGLILDDGRAIGARAVVLATGGAAALWSRTTNPPGSFGSGLMLARAAGAALADLEFAQFHPTAVVGLPGREGFLISEAVRGEGATLHGADGERFVDELAPRDAVARAIFNELARTGAASVGLDMRGVDPGRFPNVVAALREAGLDPMTRAGAGRSRQPLRDGRDRHRPRRARRGRPRPVRGRRVRVHRAPRRQPPRLQLALGVLRVRPPRRARRPGARAARAAHPRPASRSSRWPRRRAARRARRCGATPAWSAAPRGSRRCSRTRTRSPAWWPPARSRARRAAGPTPAPIFLEPIPISTAGTPSWPPARLRRTSNPGADRKVQRTISFALTTSQQRLRSESHEIGKDFVAGHGTGPRQSGVRGGTTMYRFSRAIYRELEDEILEDHPLQGGSTNHERVLKACEAAVYRLATDMHYFARPTKTLFNDIRIYFPMSSQRRVYCVVDRYLTFAREWMASQPASGYDLEGNRIECRATTRRGTACQRVPLPHNGYCPSHQHLAETEEVALAA